MFALPRLTRLSSSAERLDAVKPQSRHTTVLGNTKIGSTSIPFRPGKSKHVSATNSVKLEEPHVLHEAFIVTATSRGERG